MTAAIAQLWKEHLDSDFPTGAYGEEADGYDLALLDADVAGCVEEFLENGGRLGLRRTADLGLILGHAVLAARAVPAPARSRYERLESLARRVLEAVRDRAPAS